MGIRGVRKSHHLVPDRLRFCNIPSCCCRRTRTENGCDSKGRRGNLAICKAVNSLLPHFVPIHWLLNGSARLLTGMFGLKPASESEMAHSEEELRIILSESYKSGEINQSEYKYVNQIFEFDERIANEIMVPRTEMTVIEKGMPLLEVVELIQEEQYTRYPVIDGDKDNVVGMVNIKRLYTATITEDNVTALTVDSFVTPIIRVLETIAIHDLLLKMQKERIHMAVLTDEYGGTAGLVTVEDILEEIVGEIRDEFDQDERPTHQRLMRGIMYSTQKHWLKMSMIPLRSICRRKISIHWEDGS